MKRGNHPAPPAVGGASLLVIFAVLCLTVFSLLSLTTVLAERREADASREAYLDWYAADLQAQETFARLRQGQIPEGVAVRENVYRYTCPVDAVRHLEVALEYKNGRWTVLRWQTAAVAEEAESPLPVWDGNG